MALVIHPTIRTKLQQDDRKVTEEEICECFTNRSAGLLIDTRVENTTNPPTHWFISETDFGRKLKIVFISKDGDTIIKTAYEPNPEEIRIYNKYA
ncbi:MAG: ADP-ribosyl-(dinitrogen reductase) hydrolase [Pseudohongiella sp.]|nr:ADP-ribosyl-(dinitrogen reductase) hydrolase [Pseudohongiella sp.]MDP2091412.1 ADP-ribosyl-(dinitrogen reductase) hydrolase [Pseudohongiella sp.]